MRTENWKLDFLHSQCPAYSRCCVPPPSPSRSPETDFSLDYIAQWKKHLFLPCVLQGADFGSQENSVVVAKAVVGIAWKQEPLLMGMAQGHRQ